MYTVQLLSVDHRVDRVLGFFSGRPNWDPPPPPPTSHPLASVSYPPLVPVEGGVTHSLAGEGVGESSLDEGTGTDTMVR
jgi:hypothetical protein